MELENLGGIPLEKLLGAHTFSSLEIVPTLTFPPSSSRTKASSQSSPPDDDEEESELTDSCPPVSFK
jgi:hypothetical protein